MSFLFTYSIHKFIQSVTLVPNVSVFRLWGNGDSLCYAVIYNLVFLIEFLITLNVELTQMSNFTLVIKRFYGKT